jgi:hypothetical protein
MLRTFGNFRKLWFRCVLTLMMNQSVTLVSGLGLFATGLKPASGTHVSGFGTLQPYHAGSTDKSDWSI